MYETLLFGGGMITASVVLVALLRLAANANERPPKDREREEFIRRVYHGVVIVLALSTAQAFAAPFQLMDLEWSQPQVVTLPAAYNLYVENGSSAGWGEHVSSFPHQSFAPIENVRAINRVMTESEGAEGAGDSYAPYIVLVNAGAGPEYSVINPFFGCATCWFRNLVGADSVEWADRVAAAGWTPALHAPLLSSFGLRGYTITEIERIVTAESQTIRFYGVVPEPASGLIMLYVGLLHLSKRCRARAAGQRR